MDNGILVSVAMLTYNHEKYIRQSLDSVLMQEVDFKYEIVIGDDASTDGTQEILKEYQRLYPNKFKLLLRDKNLGPTKNFYDILINCSGKYIATLEGDDFWSDKEKLKLQAEFLEENPGYIGSSHSCNIYEQSEDKYLNEGYYYYEDNHEYAFEDFKRVQFPGHTSSMLYLNIFKDKTKDNSILYTADRNTGDRTVVLLLVLSGKIYCFGRNMSTYRKVRSPGESNINSLYANKNKLLVEFNYLLKLDEFSKNIRGESCLTRRLINNLITSAFVVYAKNKNDENKHIFQELYKHRDRIYLYYLVRCIKLLAQEKVLNFARK